MLRVVQKRPPILVTFRQTAVNALNLSSYTFTNQDIGTAFVGRVVVVGFTPFTSISTVSNITSVTIGGVTATQLSAGIGGSNIQVVLYAAIVSTGTLATVIINFSSQRDNCGIAVWTLENAAGFSEESFQSAGTSSAASITNTFPTVNAGDAIIVMCRIRSANVGTYTLTGVTENFEQVVESGISAQLGGFRNITANATNYAVTIATSGLSPFTNFCIVRFFFP